MAVFTGSAGPSRYLIGSVCGREEKARLVQQQGQPAGPAEAAVQPDVAVPAAERQPWSGIFEFLVLTGFPGHEWNGCPGLRVRAVPAPEGGVEAAIAPAEARLQFFETTPVAVPD